jgi:hypothetical protein
MARVSTDGNNWVECDGAGLPEGERHYDEVEVQAALDSLPDTGGIVYLEGVFTFAGGPVARAIDNVTIKGEGPQTTVSCNASTPLFSDGGQAGWQFRDFNTDAGGLLITYIGGTDITYSSGRGSSAKEYVTDLNTVEGGWHNVYSIVNTVGEYATAGAGIIGIKSVINNTSAVNDGNFLAGQFIAKHNSDSEPMRAEACLIGIEAIGYDAATASAGVGVMIGVNAVIRSYATAAYGGGVHRGVQIIVDEATRGADEVTALCIWNMGASAVDAIRIVGAGTMGNFLYLDAAGGAVQTGDLVAAHAPDGSSIGADAFLVCAIGATPYYSPLYNSKA